MVYLQELKATLAELTKALELHTESLKVRNELDAKLIEYVQNQNMLLINAMQDTNKMLLKAAIGGGGVTGGVIGLIVALLKVAGWM